MNTTLIRDETTIARAMSDFQRKPAAPLRYPLLTRIGDWSAGIHDQAFAHDGELDTPRLQALRHEFATRLEHERRDTLALIAVLDERLAELRASQAAAQSEEAVAEVEGAALERATVDDRPVTLSETYDDAEHRLNRRIRGRDARKAAAGQRQQAARAAIEQIQADIERTTAARQSHWTLMLVRCHHILGLGNRRAATYTRSLTRRLGGRVLTPMLYAPDWLTEQQLPAFAAPTFAVTPPVSILRTV